MQLVAVKLAMPEELVALATVQFTSKIGLSKIRSMIHWGISERVLVVVVSNVELVLLTKVMLLSVELEETCK